MENLTHGVKLIAEERQKQIEKHGFSLDFLLQNPKYYSEGQLQHAAARVLSVVDRPAMYISAPTNWDKDWFFAILKKASEDEVYRLTVSATLLAEELDRIEGLKK